MAYFQTSRNDSFKYLVLKLANGWSYKYQIFTCITLVSYLQEHPLYKNQAAKFPIILDSFSLSVDRIRWAPTWVGGGVEGGQDGGFEV